MNFKQKCKNVSLLGCMILVAALIAACSGKKDAEEIFNSQKSGVVLVLNKFYYEVEMPSGQKLFFKGINGNGELEGFTADEREVQQNPAMLNGTGFFISDDGLLVTNRHVAATDIDEKQLKQQLQRIIRSAILQYAYAQQQLEVQYDQLEQQRQALIRYYEMGQNVDVAQVRQIQAEQERIKALYQNVTANARNLRYNTNFNDISIHVVCAIGISYDGVKVQSPADFLDKNPCEIIKISADKDADLALLQLKSRKTPENAHIFQFAGEGNKKFFNGKESETELKIDQQLYMIGYNAGLVLANTEKGISVQMTSGRITQTPDNDRVLYSIPTVQGSSGSPVVDEYGNVVAVNFAKLAGSDNFNFGIPVSRVKDFLKDVK